MKTQARKAQIRKNTLKDGRVRYSCVIDLGKDENGRRITESGGTFATEREAIEAGIKLEAKYSTDLLKTAALRGKMTLKQWADEWFDSLKGEVKESTRLAYWHRLNKWILPHLGSIRLAELDSVHIERFLKKLTSLSTNYKKSILETLKNCLNGAVKDKALLVNPAQNVQIARTKSMKAAEQEEDELASAEKVWSHEEVVAILDAAVGCTAEALPVLGLLGGLRPGEVEGIKWSEIDLMEGVVWVRRANRASASTKSGKSRKVKLPFDAVRRLVALQDRQEPGTEYVMPLSARMASDRLIKTCEKAGVKVLSPHCCRHTFASLLLSANVPSTVVAKILGHSNSGVTEKYYAWALPKDLDDAPKVLERILELAPGPVPDQTDSTSRKEDHNA